MSLWCFRPQIWHRHMGWTAAVVWPRFFYFSAMPQIMWHILTKPLCTSRLSVGECSAVVALCRVRQTCCLLRADMHVSESVSMERQE